MQDILDAQKIGQHVESHEFRRQERAVFTHFPDAGIHAGDEGAGDSLDPRVEVLPLLFEGPAIEEKPRSLVEGNEGRAEHFGKSAKPPPMDDVELPQAQRRGGVALPEESVVHAAGGNVRNPPPIDGNVERCRKALHDGIARLPTGGRPGEDRRQENNCTQGQPQVADARTAIFRHVIWSVRSCPRRQQACPRGGRGLND